MNTNAPLGQTSDGCGVERRSSGGLAGQPNEPYTSLSARELHPGHKQKCGRGVYGEFRLTVQKGETVVTTRWLPACQRQSAEQLLRERGYVVVAEDYR